MKRKLYQFFPLIGLCLLIEGCQPDVDELTIESCLLSKVDNLGLDPVVDNDGKVVAIIANSSSTVFAYDKTNRPITFSYYSDSQLTGYDEVIYNSDGTLKRGESYNSSDKLTGTIEYTFNTEKQITEQHIYNSDEDPTGFLFYTYTNTKLLSEVTDVTVDYDSFYFTGLIFRYEYDSKNNLVKRYSKFLKRVLNSSDPNFSSKFLADLKSSKEYLNITLSDYDDQFNPYRSQPTLAVLFDDLPSYNNARKITYNYVNSGEKYADVIYTFQYNRKGFPYIYTKKLDYTSEYTSATKIQDYTTTSSFEYLCK